MILGMEKACEFCRTSGAAIYCGADAAYLCLCCDARVHSANTLSARHHRSVLCDTCRFGPAQWRDRRSVMCGPCSGGASSSRTVRPFSGCPSADNFAALWGFMPSDIAAQLKISQKPQEKGNRGYILQQIVELKRLQLSEGNSNNQIHGQQQQNNNVSLMREFVKKYNDNEQQQDSSRPDQATEPNTSSIGLKQEDGIEERFPFPFSQLGNPINTEPLGQYSQELWSQNMQDLGVCEELVFQDDFNIPEVDSTFQNFEDMFGGDHDTMQSLLDNNHSFFSIDKEDLSIGKFDNCHSGIMEDISMTSTMSDTDKDTGISKVKNLHLSRFLSISPESPISPNLSGGETSSYSLNSDNNKSSMHEKLIRYPSRKREHVRKRTKGHRVRIGDCDSDDVDVARSY